MAANRESFQFVTGNIDLARYPEPNPEYTSLDAIKGDLHSNPINFIHFLRQLNLIELKNGANDYKRLHDIYYLEYIKIKRESKGNAIEFNNKLKILINEFLDILKKAKIKNIHTLIKLIGDELGDRGNHDLFILCILKWLGDEKRKIGKPACDIFMSNHAIEFILWYEAELFQSKSTAYGPLSTPLWSLNALRESVAADAELKETVKQLINNYYKPCLKVLGYSVSEDKKEIAILTHAGTPIDIIYYRVKDLNKRAKTQGHRSIEYHCSTIEKLMKTIDDINNIYMEEYVKKNKIHALYTLEDAEIAISTYSSGTTINYKTHPFIYLMWNRQYTYEKKPLNRPTEFHGYKVHYVHGHDESDPIKKQVYDLDTLVGKNNDDANNVGCYSFESMANLPNNNIRLAKVGKIYLSCVKSEEGSILSYVVIDTNGSPQQGSINVQDEDLTDLVALLNDIELLQQILEVIKNNGHIHRAEKTELQSCKEGLSPILATVGKPKELTRTVKEQDEEKAYSAPAAQTATRKLNVNAANVSFFQVPPTEESLVLHLFDTRKMEKTQSSGLG